tara:strand:- start:6779 stop:9574 length:2796 start_codon:yes stop_codon:yes gene_type:complete
MNLKFPLSFLLIFSTFFLSASVPDIINYTTKDYNAHSINYDCIQDTSGVIYIANAYCVLEYDGQTFRKIPLVAGKSAVSLAKDSHGKIYIGSSSDFGCLTKDSQEKTVYSSLKHLMPTKKEINEIFKTIWYDNAIYFASNIGIFRYQNNTIESVKGFTDSTLIDAFQLVNGELLYWENAKGLGKIKGLESHIFHSDTKTRSVTSIEFINNHYTLFGKFGIKMLQKPNHEYTTPKNLDLSNVSTTLKLNDHEFLIGTTNAGIFLMDSNGNLKRNFNTSHGLKDNFVRNLFQDNSGNIWIAYNNGIGLLKWGSPLQYITHSQKFDGMGYAGLVYENNLYIGTSTGLYMMSNWKEELEQIGNFTKVEGIPDGTINYLTIANGQLIICQSAETYTLKNQKAQRISDGAWYGSWLWKTANYYNKNEGFVGTYEGVERYLYNNNQWNHKGHIKGFMESSRSMEIDQRGIIWAIQGNKGLYRVELNNERDSAISVINYAEKKGFEPDDFNDIFYLNNILYIATFKGVYQLNNDTLVRDHSFDGIFRFAKRIRKYDSKHIYGIYNDKAYLFKKENNKWNLIPSSITHSRSSLIGSAEFFYTISPEYHLMGTQEGFVLYQASKESTFTNTQCLIRNLELLGDERDSILYYNKPKQAIDLPYANNNLRFTFSIPEFGITNQIIFQTQLLRNNNKQDNWQNVKEVNFREYTNLKEGEYTFTVRAKKGDTILGAERYAFNVLPPWYRTTAFKMIYLIALIAGIFIVRARFKKQANKLKAEKERELQIKEKLHKAEKLEIELKNKENEMAYMALSYTQKKDMLSSLENKLDALSKELEHSERTKLNSLKRTISSSIDDESNWENFQVHFDQKNDNFFQKLNSLDGKLNESYLLFCSYVKMGKSNKEIADLLHISVAAVEKRKYRLKKKWNLDNDTSFTHFLRTL